MSVTAIQTRYAGCHFRSRLEARWAVFFDHLNIRWEYEPQGFEIFGGHRYLPDFYLPATGTWVEVKGTFGPTELATIINAVDYGGLPGIEDGLRTERGLLLLGPIPRTSTNQWPLHSLFTHHEGVERELAVFHPKLGLVNDFRFTGDSWTASGTPREEIDDTHARQVLTPGSLVAHNPGNTVVAAVQCAYTAARSARFEHGQIGATL